MLVVVLAVVFFLSVILARFLEDTVEMIEYRALFDPVPEQRLLAYSYLEAGLAVIQEIALLEEAGLLAPEQGWGNPLSHPGFPELPGRGSVSIRVEDISARFPLHSMDEALLRALFEEMALPDSVVRELTDSLLDWIDEDDERRLNGAESDDYLSGPIPYRAANRPLQSFAELQLISGFQSYFFDPETGRPNELYEKFVSAVALEDFAALNLNTASPLAIQTIARMEGWEPRYLWDGSDYGYLEARPANIGSSLVDVRAGLLRVVVDMSLGGSTFGIEAIVRPDIGKATSASDQGLPGRAVTDTVRRTAATEEQDAMSYPFRILSLSENGERRPAPPQPYRDSMVDRM